MFFNYNSMSKLISEYKIVIYIVFTIYYTRFVMSYTVNVLGKDK